MTELEDDVFTHCEACGKSIGYDDHYHAGADVDLCADCAPQYADLLAHPESFADSEGDPMTLDAAKAIYDAHIAGGGKPSDKIGIPTS